MTISTADFHASLPYVDQVQKINYENEIRSIATDTSITTYFGLVKKVRELGVKLDYKTQPNIGGCAGIFNVIQPWALVASPTVSGKAPTVTIAEASIAALNVNGASISLDEGGFNRFFRASIPNGVSSYKGFVVESINGKAPLDLANDVFSGDTIIGAAAAFTYTYLYNRTMFIQNGFLTQFHRPDLSTYFQKEVTYKLRNPTTNAIVDITVPWLVTPDDYNTVFETILPRCFSTPSSAVAMGLDFDPIFTHAGQALSHRPTLRLASDHSVSPRLTKRQAESSLTASLRAALPNLPANSERPAFAHLVDSTTMAIMLVPDNTDSYDPETPEFVEYQKAYFTALAADVKRVREQNPGVKNLIIDVTNNYWLCDHHVIIKYLLGDFKPLEYSVASHLP
ncbi:hypothetical protein BC829DRAFT_265314 [Chytridium lagenaria]|nr:hypothetical protein BC829DRAFT_265314 [Chytridium lagenaria]